MKIQPRNKYILIDPEPVAEKVSEHGIISPDNVEQERKAVGEVLAVSDGITDIKKGDKIVFGVYSGEDIEIEQKGKKKIYKLVHDDDVIAILK